MAVKPKGRADTGDARNVLKKPSQSRSDVRSIKPALLALRRMGCPFEGISGENRSAIESVGNFCSPSCRVHEPRTLASLGFRGRPPPFLAKIASLTPSKRPGQVSISDGAVDIHSYTYLEYSLESLCYAKGINRLFEQVAMDGPAHSAHCGCGFPPLKLARV